MIRFNFRSEKLEAQTLRYIQISLWPGFCYPPIPTYGGIPALMLVAAFGFGADDRQYGYTYPATVSVMQSSMGKRTVCECAAILKIDVGGRLGGGAFATDWQSSSRNVLGLVTMHASGFCASSMFCSSLSGHRYCAAPYYNHICQQRLWINLIIFF